MDITNKTRKPVSIPLPGGKKLFLGPGKTGQVSQKGIEYPPVAALIETGELETTGDSKKRHERGSSSKAGPNAGSGHKGTGAMRQSGDR